MNNDPMGKATRAKPLDEKAGPLGRERSGLIGFLILIGALTFGVAVALDVGGLGAWFSSTVLGTAASTAAAAAGSSAADAGRGAPQPFLQAIAGGQPDAGPAPAVNAAEITQAWYVDAAGYTGAEAERSATHAPMLIYFRKRPCEICRRVDHELLAAPELKAQLATTVKVRIDIAAGPAEARLAAMLGVNELPSLVLVPPSGNAHAIPFQRGGILLTPAQVAASIH